MKDILTLPKIYPTPTMGGSSKKDHIYHVNDETLLKTFFNKTGAYVSNKIYTIEALLEEEKEFPIAEINYPTGILEIDNVDIGYAMPYVHGQTLFRLLQSNLPFETKIAYLKEVGKVLDKMDEARRETIFHDFFINDIHEKNFMIADDGSLKVLDVDSMIILGNKATPSMYLKPLVKFMGLEKYPTARNEFTGKYIKPSKDTEIYCYCMMILNFLFGTKQASYLNHDEFNNYLDYLETIGVDKELTSIFRRLYTEKENVNPMEYLDGIPNTPLVRERFYQKAKRNM